MNVREITERGRRAGHIRTISDRDPGSQQIPPGSRIGVLLKSRGETPSPTRRTVIAAPVSSLSLFDYGYFLMSDFTASGTAKAASGTSFTDTSRMVSTILLGPTMASLRVGNLRPPKSL